MSHEALAAERFEDLAISVALRLVQQHEAFYSHPTDDGVGGIVIGWLRNLKHKGISKQAATHMLQEDLRENALKLRARIITVGQERLGTARVAVILFLAQLPEIGADKVLAWTTLWTALREERWDDAADALLVTEFPHAMGTGSKDKVVRAVALQRVLRSGKQFKAEELVVAGLGIA